MWLKYYSNIIIMDGRANVGAGMRAGGRAGRRADGQMDRRTNRRTDANFINVAVVDIIPC